MPAILALLLTLTTRPKAIAARYSLHYNGEQESTIPDCPALDIQKEVTAECWIKPDGGRPEQYFRYLLSKNYGSAGWGLVMSRDYRVNATGIGQTLKKVPINEWTHVAYVCSDKKAKIYINGKLAEVNSVGEPLHNSDLQLCIGCSSFFGEPGHQLTNFNGTLAEVRVWDKAFTAREIRRRMRHRLTGHEAHLVVYLPLDEGTGTMAHNKTGKTPPLRLGRSFRPDKWDPTWVEDSPFRRSR